MGLKPAFPLELMAYQGTARPRLFWRIGAWRVVGTDLHLFFTTMVFLMPLALVQAAWDMVELTTALPLSLIHGIIQSLEMCIKIIFLCTRWAAKRTTQARDLALFRRQMFQTFQMVMCTQ